MPSGTEPQSGRTYEFARLVSPVSTAAKLVWTRLSASEVEVAEARDPTACSALDTAPRTVWTTVERAALLLRHSRNAREGGETNYEYSGW